jgi:ubiquinone/menaquinone biosynthesis C-methylase UbiE
MALGVQGYYADVTSEQIPLPAGSTDVVFVGSVIEHLPHSPRTMLAEARRLLRPGGHLVIDTKNAVDLKTRLKVLAGVSNWPDTDYIYNADWNAEHHKEYTLHELAHVVELAGFDVVERVYLERFFRQSLRKLGTLRTMGVDRSQHSAWGEGFNPRHAYEYARLVALGLVQAVPSLRSEILVVGRRD